MHIGFNLTGDFVRGHSLASLGSLLDKGVKVALVYGDRDYQCNWLGGEAISLAIKSNAASSFTKAGYANIETNSSFELECLIGNHSSAQTQSTKVAMYRTAD